MIKLRKGEPRGFVRREMAKNFANNKDTYRLRGLIEAVFGGLETKYGNRTRCRLHKSRRVDCLLMVVSHNLRTYANLLESHEKFKELKFGFLTFAHGPKTKQISKAFSSLVSSSAFSSFAS